MLNAIKAGNQLLIGFKKVIKKRLILGRFIERLILQLILEASDKVIELGKIMLSTLNDLLRFAFITIKVNLLLQLGFDTVLLIELELKFGILLFL